MKKTIILALCMLAGLSFASCNPEESKDKPDLKAEITSLILTQEKNAFLSKDYVVIIDNDSLLFPLPKAIADTSFIASFKLTQDDVLSINGQAIDGDFFTIAPTDTNIIEISVTDECCNITKKYGYRLIDTDDHAELFSMVFSAAANPNILSQDVAAYGLLADCSVALPDEALGKSIVAKFAATMNDIITVNGQAVAADSTCTIDTSFPIDIVVTDPIANESVKYVIRFVKSVKSTWNQVASYNESSNGWFHMAMGNTYPFVTYLTTDKAVRAMKYNGQAFEAIGTGNISESTSTAVYIAVNNDIPYVFYTDAGASTKNTYSCRTFANDAWAYLGARGFGDKSTGLYPKYQASFAINGATGYPVSVVTANAENKATGVAKRGACVSIWSGTEWAANKPVNGRKQIMAYTPRLAKTKDGFYLLECNQTEKTFSLYKYTTGWATVADDFSVGGSDLGTTSVALTCDRNGKPYAALASNKTGNWLCTIYTVGDNGFEQAFNTLPSVTFGKTNAIFDLTFDKDNNPVVAFINEDNDLLVMPYDGENKTWAQAKKLGEAYNGSFLGIGSNADGNIFICASKVIDTKNTILLYQGVIGE